LPRCAASLGGHDLPGFFRNSTLSRWARAAVCGKLARADRAIGYGVLDMTKIYRTMVVVAALAALSLGSVAPAEAGRCFKKAASGTNTTMSGAKAQVYEALLQSFDWGAWAAYMATGSTPGYRVGAPSYKCTKGGLGYNCRGVSTICKTS
jgi:hypothetical protein